MIFGSVCSGIEAASVAWKPLGWKAAWLAEIDKFPSAVLAHHYPSVPNLGDMTKITTDEYANSRPIDLLVGGTPCQSFSVAGLRKGLADPRGNLALTYLGIADHFKPRWVVWENVPGVLSSGGGRDFGAFLGALGELGYGYAYRVLDAQYFGVPQRRRRVFVVGYFGDWRRAAAVLFESESLLGNPPKSRSKGQKTTGSATCSVALRGRNGGATAELGDDVAHALRASSGGGDKAHVLVNALTATGVGTCGADDNQAQAGHLIAHTLRGEGFDASEDGTGRSTPLTIVKPIAIQERAICENPNAGPDGIGVRTDGLAYTLEARGTSQAVVFSENQRAEVLVSDTVGSLKCGGGKPGQGYPAVLIDAQANRLISMETINAGTQKTDTVNLLQRVRDAIGAQAFAQWGLGILDSLQSPEILRSALHGSELRPTAFSRRWVVCCALGSPFSRSAGAMHSMREAAGEGCSPQGWGFSEQCFDKLGAYLSKLSQPGAQAERLMHDLWQTAQRTGILRDALSAVQKARRPPEIRLADEKTMFSGGVRVDEPRARPMQQARTTSTAGNPWAETENQERVREVSPVVRRLIVEECEFLQGFPRGYTAVPYRDKPAADGNKYKALGNSMAVPVMAWLGRRIQEVDTLQTVT